MPITYPEPSLMGLQTVPDSSLAPSITCLSLFSGQWDVDTQNSLDVPVLWPQAVLPQRGCKLVDNVPDPLLFRVTKVRSSLCSPFDNLQRITPINLSIAH